MKSARMAIRATIEMQACAFGPHTRRSAQPSGRARDVELDTPAAHVMCALGRLGLACHVHPKRAPKS
jgi:hypothetical protein